MKAAAYDPDEMRRSTEHTKAELAIFQKYYSGMDRQYLT
jgi:hypothetical protein